MKFSNDEYTLSIDDLGYKKQVDIIRVPMMEYPDTVAVSVRTVKKRYFL